MACRSTANFCDKHISLLVSEKRKCFQKIGGKSGILFSKSEGSLTKTDFGRGLDFIKQTSDRFT